MKRNVWYLMVLSVLLVFVVAGCGDETSGNENNDENNQSQNEENTGENNNAENNENDGDSNENATVDASEDAIFSVLNENAAAMNDKDVDRYMATVHEESPLYDETVDLVNSMFANYDLDVELHHMEIMEQTDDEVSVSFLQVSREVSGAEYQDNESEGIFVLRPYEGEWKIYDTEILDARPLDDGLAGNEAVGFDQEEMEAAANHLLDRVTYTIDDRDWYLAYYDEAGGDEIVEMLLEEETIADFSELYSIQYMTNVQISLPEYLESFEILLGDDISGEYEFGVIDEQESEAVYEFIVGDDPFHDDQHELARVILQDNEIYVFRYTAIDHVLEGDEKDEWVAVLEEASVESWLNE